MCEQDNIEKNAGRPDFSRRQFLTRTGLTMTGLAAATLAAPAASHAGQAAAQGTAKEPMKIILGSGQYRYECVHDWLLKPDYIEWGDTQGIAEDSRGNIYISHTVGGGSVSQDAIVVFDKAGKFLTSFGSRFAGGGHGLELRKEANQEFLYHCDTAHRMFVKTTLTGEVIWEKGTPQEPGVYKEGVNFVPTNIAFSPNGDFYVADGYGSSYIHQYDIRGNWIRTFAGPGTDPGKCRTPHGLWVDTRLKDPLLAVADRSNNRIQYFTLDGKHVSFVSEGMRQPCHFKMRGDELLVPDLNSVVTILDKDNKVAVQLGDGADVPDLRGHKRSEFKPGKFIHPHDAIFLHNGDIVVAEWVPNGRVTLLRKLKV